MSLSPFDNALLRDFLGDAEVEAALCAEADIRAMLAFEAALARAEAIHGLIPAEAAETIATVCVQFQPDVAALARGVASDGVVVPALVRALRAAVGPEAAPHVHRGATSQDVIDTSLMLRLKPLAARFCTRLGAILARLAALDAAFGERALMGHTRMQAALPITVSDRLRSWSGPLAPLMLRLDRLSFPVQFGGAVGTLEGLEGKGAQVRAALAAELDLEDTPQWHSTRTVITDLGHLLALITGGLGKMGQDIALMAQAGDDITLSGGGGSSAMPHKQNPVAAETLVALARFNAVQASALQQAMVHEQERSGAAWTLEWLTLPHMLAATGAALRHAEALTLSILRLGGADDTRPG
ncbi:3-carboxy-cis,cis-muconate cycloisomerase protein [Azorhizobium caulinodans ORS 571]|uniref:3-carboxy-cis,cis-muconate cycloisomerase n=1 Tax=Azorhizobium caulinodans (strain ATCC 43989 / DSM 5975 / JCM 20966 / LMG 6465 / NBRC 14845 / NCIMB 13405 / ORS 571) TaxID=438753 RepID=A8HWY4_AZOC5|nr:3-carboxy-cis,cis-muconate cycloisomerase [Azorhizobium caulinodans]BAF87439.1 3-carboxy-cis,cis-muconate cycloisomerase protein [Azorhizobium caulinodans ORS 571]